MHGGGIGTLRQRVSWQEAEGHRLWIWSGPVKPPAVEFTGHLLWARSQARPWRVLNLAAGRAGLGTWGREGTLRVREPWRLCPAKPENRGLRGGARMATPSRAGGQPRDPAPHPLSGLTLSHLQARILPTVVSPQHLPQGWASS